MLSKAEKRKAEARIDRKASASSFPVALRTDTAFTRQNKTRSIAKGSQLSLGSTPQREVHSEGMALWKDLVTVDHELISLYRKGTGSTSCTMTGDPVGRVAKMLENHQQRIDLCKSSTQRADNRGLPRILGLIR
jgi:hypothetical protein